MNAATVVRRASAAFCALAVGLLLALPAQAQQGTVQGLVTDQADQPVANVQVSLQGTGIGALSGADGRYQLTNVPPGEYTLVAQRIGYARATQEGVTVTAGQVTDVNVQVQRQALELADIVVTGVTEATERANVPFTVGQVTSAQMPITPRSAVGALQARVAGAAVVESSQPGQSDNILLRTPTSIHRSNQPLFVVDGAIITGRTMDLSTMDIESIEVVKGAAAASLYGSRAAAGVIQIRTVRGSGIAEDQTQLRVRSEYGTNEIANPIGWATRHNLRMDEQGNFLGCSDEVVRDRFLACTTRFGFQDQEYPGGVFDHVDAIHDPGANQSHTVSLGHNSRGTNWLATASHQRDGGVIRHHQGYERTDVRLNVDHRPREDLNVSLSAFHMRSVRDELPSGTFFDLINTAPDVSLLGPPDEDGTPYPFQPDEFGIRTNPLYRIWNFDDEWEATRTLASADLRYHPVPWLSVDANVSYDRADQLRREWIPRGVKTPDRSDGGDGESRRDSRFTDGINAAGGLSATRQFGPLRARSAARFLVEDQYDHRVQGRGEEAAVGGIPDLGTHVRTFILSNEQRIRAEGYFLTGEFDYDGRYILNTLVRRDGSSLFGRDERWHTYYRFSTAWRMAAEEWWPWDNVNEFRLRYSRGTAGGRPNFADRFEVFSVGTGGTLSLDALGNRRLKPETTTEQEFGLDVVTHDRFSVEFVYARQETVDQLISVPLPMMFGFGSQWQNAGTIEGNTIEIDAQLRAIERPNFAWTVGLIADRSRNKITEYQSSCFLDDGQRRCAGERVGAWVTRQFARSFDHVANVHSDGARDHFQVNDDGLLVAVGAGNTYRDGVANELWGSTVEVEGQSYAWGMPILRVNDDGLIDVFPTGDGNPDLRLGVNNQFQWGNFHLYTLIDGQVGGDLYNRTQQRQTQWLRSAFVDQHQKPMELRKPVDYYTAYLYEGNRYVDWWIEPAQHLRIREISLSYNLDPYRIGLLQGVGMDRMTLSLVGRNLHYWTSDKFTGYDPVRGSPTDMRENFSFPSYRTITASIDIQF